MRGNDDEIIDNWYADLYDQTETRTEDAVQSNYFDKEVNCLYVSIEKVLSF